MRAVGVTQFGGPEALEVVELPEPSAGPGQIKVAVHAAAVNPTDTMTRNGARAQALSKDPPPYVPGMDVAGVVEEIGEGAAEVAPDLSVGDHVMAIVLPDGAHGGYASKLALPAGSVVRVPDGVDDATAATLPMNALTARLALDRLDLRPGATVAVTGAAGAFGGYLIQLAKVDGLRVVADSSEADEELVRSLGADVVVRRGEGVADRIREVVAEGVDGLADGAVQNDAVIPAVRDGGGIATVRGYAGPQDGSDRGINWYPVMVWDYGENRPALDRLREQVEKGEVTLRLAGSLPAEQAPEAHRRLEAGGVRGRQVLTF